MMSKHTPHKPSLSAAEYAMNSMANFTRGPWEAKNFYVFAGADCIAICDTDNASAERYKANARLIASAPELLACVREFVELLAQPPCSALNVADIKYRALAAIAKATGTKMNMR